nr:hypothetical protein [Tanacetum cinerariifolium]
SIRTDNPCLPFWNFWSLVDHVAHLTFEYSILHQYTTSITKTKATRHEIVGIEDMTPTLWSIIKHGYDKDAEKEIKHWDDMRKLCDIVDFIVALRMFTRSPIIKSCVKDLQLGVESYQKKLNITAPQKTFPKIEFKELYTPSYKPPGNTNFRLGYNEEMSRRKWMAIHKRRSELMVKLIDKQT